MVECETWKPGDVMKATGIPPHVMISLKTDVMAEQVKCLRENVCQSLSRVSLDQADLERGVPTLGQINSIISRECQRIIDSFNERIHQREQEQQQSADGEMPADSAVLPELYLTEKNVMARLPPDFSLPRGNLQTA